MAHGLLSLISVSVLAPSVTISAGDRTELRLRNAVDRADAVDLITAPQLQLTLATYRARWQLAYSPVLTRLDVGGPDTTTLLIHTGSLTTDITLSRRTRLSFSESASYGTQNFRVLGVAAAGANAGAASAPTPAPGQGGTAPAVPLSAQAGNQDTTIKFGSVSGSATLLHEFHPRWRGSATGTASTSGSLGSDTGNGIPRSKQALGVTALSHAVTSRDGLTLQVEGQVARTDPGILARIVGGELTWARRFSRTLVGSVSAGESYARVTLPGGEVLSRALPTAGASVDLSGGYRGWRNSLTLSEEFAQYVDRLLGTVSQRTQTTLTARATRNSVTLLAAGYGTAATFSVGQSSLQYAYGATESVTYRLDRHWSLEFGSRQTWLRFQNVAQPQNVSQQPMLWAVYSALAYTTGDWPL